MYKLRFNKKHIEIMILPVPLLFDLLEEKFLVTPAAVNNHRAQAFTPESEPELDPYRASSVQWSPEMTSQWYPDYTSQYTGESSGGLWH